MEATITDRGLKLTAPDRREELMAAGSAAVLMAENVEGRYGEDADLARMLRTANDFASDVVKFDAADDAAQDAHDYEGAHGQFADVLLLGMAAGWFARTLRRDHNKGKDPETFEAAAECMADVWDTTFRQMGISAIGGQLDRIEYRYGDGYGG